MYMKDDDDDMESEKFIYKVWIVLWPQKILY